MSLTIFFFIFYELFENLFTKLLTAVKVSDGYPNIQQEYQNDLRKQTSTENIPKNMNQSKILTTIYSYEFIKKKIHCKIKENDEFYQSKYFNLNSTPKVYFKSSAAWWFQQ